jgi:Subtilase family/FG-GAP-like repeat
MAQDSISSTLSASTSMTAAVAATIAGLSRIDSQLGALLLSNSSMAAAATSFTTAVQQFAGSISADGQSVLIDATAADGNGAALLNDLAHLGLTGGASFDALASGWLPISQLGALTELSNLNFARESVMISNTGSVTTQADHAMQSDAARASLGVTGAGIKVGVLSDSFNALGGYSADIASGNLPAGVQILQDSGTTDEGRAMAQIVYDVAPGAALAFATANGGQANFANNIIALLNAGAKVIVDDVSYFAEPMFQDGVIARAVQQAVGAGAVYFSAAANNGHKGYESAFLSAGAAQTINGKVETWHNYNSSSPTIFMPFAVASGRTATVVLEWNQPAASASPAHGATSDLDLIVTDNSATHSIVSLSQTNNVGHDPIEIVQFTNNSGAAQTYNIVVGLTSGAAPSDMKIVTFNGNGAVGNGFASNTNDGTVYGHAAAADAIAVGAAYYAQTPAFGTSPPIIESFSSGGPTKIFFDINGNPISEIRATPEITAPDGGNTSFFGSDDGDADSFPNFFGTSAAAPAAAGVAALMLQANGSLNAGAIKGLLMSSAIDMDNPATAGFDTGFDVGTGAGLIQADRAVAAAASKPHIMTSIDLGAHPAGWLPTGIGDFNNDGTPDIAWYNSTTTNTDLWKISSGQWAGSVNVGPHPAGWQPVGVGDFNQDGTSDILWFNPASGNVDIWTIANGQWAGSVNVGSHPAGWQPVGVGDFNQDGTSDVLWFNPTSGNVDIWKIANGQWAGSVNVGSHPAGWQPVGVGDFNHDGTSDILWFNPASGNVDIWKIANGQWAGSVNAGNHPAGWQPAGVADFNHDGTSDIVWLNAATGNVDLWQIVNGQWGGSASIGNHATGWNVVGVGDFNHDGTSDILWRNPSTGRVEEWLVTAS